MFGTHDLWLFVLSGLLLNIAPGPDTFYILSRTASQGWRGGAVAALGIGGGCFVHIFAAALGLSALLAASATAFTVLKWVGGAYLVWMGIAMLRTPARALEPDANAPQQRLRRVFAQGFATNALNPKVALFFLAFLPQFIAADAPAKCAAFLLLGALFNFNSLFVNVPVAWLASRAGRRLRAAPRAMRWVSRGTGCLFIALAARLSLLSRN